MIGHFLPPHPPHLIRPRGHLDGNRASSEQKPPKKLLDAITAFRSFLRNREPKLGNHYFSVNQRANPLRRADGEKITSTTRLFHIQKNFQWDNSHGKWIRNDGGPIVAEDEIYKKILSFQRIYP